MAWSFVARYISLKTFAEMGLTIGIETLDSYDAEAFEIIHASLKRAEKEARKQKTNGIKRR